MSGQDTYLGRQLLATVLGTDTELCDPAHLTALVLPTGGERVACDLVLSETEN